MAHEIQLKRRLAASADEVYAAWTDPRSLAEWMRPLPGGRTEATADARVGGKFRVDMYDKEGKLYRHEGEYLRLERPRLVEFSWISDATERQRSIVTVELRSVGENETELTLSHRLLPSERSAQAHAEGWTSILVELAAALNRP
jgi:uncharacterized protein YndB with AHSA1/START domain